MERMICLDGVAVRLDVDRLEVDLLATGLLPADHLGEMDPSHCCNGDAWHPVMSFEDGTTLYLHGPSDGSDGPFGYKVEGPRPHRWSITLLEPGAETTEKVARLSWEVVEGDPA
jgi:hypothetical protein